MERILSLSPTCHVLALICTLTPYCASAQDNTPIETTATAVQSADQVLRSTPNGQEIATLRQNAAVKILESKDDWTHVVVEGWIRSAALKAVAPPPQATTTPPPVTKTIAPISLVSTELKHVDAQSGKLAQMNLTLKVRNNLNTAVASWDGILVVQSSPQEVLFSTAVSDKKPLAPGATAEITYFWEDGDEQYIKLKSANKSTIRYNLMRVQFAQE